MFDPGKAVESRDGRARRRHSPRHAAAADAAGARARVPAARRGRLDARRHRRRASRREGGVGCRARAGWRPRGDDLRHALPSGPRRGRCRPPRADRRAGRTGRARLRAVRARVGESRLVGAARRLVPAPGRAPTTSRPSSWARAPCTGRSSATSATRSSSRPASTSTAGSSSPRPVTPTGSSASCATACSSPPITCSARITPTVGLWPASRADPLGDYLAALDRTIELAPRIALPGHGDPIEDPAGRARELQEHHRVRLGEARPRSRGRAADRATSSRSRSSAPSSRPRGGASRSPRRSRTSSGSCTRARPRGTRPTGPLPILPPDQRGRRHTRRVPAPLDGA